MKAFLSSPFFLFMRAHLRWALLLGTILIAVLALSVFWTLSPGVLRVSFLTVGQGDAVLVTTPSGVHLLYDAGPADGAVLPALGATLPWYDRSIALLVGSHQDLDHIGGVPEVLARYHVGEMLLSKAAGGSGAVPELFRRASSTEVVTLPPEPGTIIDLGDGVRAQVLMVDGKIAQNDPVDVSDDTNAASVVLRISYGKTSVLLSGDLPQAGEERLARAFGTQLSSQLLKLGHHGSRTSTSPVFLSAVAPEDAIVSVGANNRFGHPHKEVLDLLTERKIPFFRTDTEGTITFESDGETWGRRE